MVETTENCMDNNKIFCCLSQPKPLTAGEIVFVYSQTNLVGKIKNLVGKSWILIEKNVHQKLNFFGTTTNFYWLDINQMFCQISK